VEDSRRLADTDGLTGLVNRRAFTMAMRTELARCDRHGYPLTFLLLDVDHFKMINDQRGHAAGDRVLSGLGALFAEQLRICDVVARWGGEVFVGPLTSTDLWGGLATAERIRSTAESLELRSETGELIPITVSIGVATRDRGESLDAALERADQAMYRAKEGGRNRVVPAPSPDSRDGDSMQRISAVAPARTLAS
jgi:diguanylate cyclase (GGDEF)-like protein